MARVFMLAVNTTVAPYPVYPLGMSVVSAALIQAGHTVQQFDFLASGKSLSDLLAAVRAFAPEYIGISLRNVDNVDSLSAREGWYLKESKELIAHLRAVSLARIILGGPGFSLLPEPILTYLEADYGIVGEGERAMPELLDRLQRKEPAPRLYASSSALCPQEMSAPALVRDMVHFYQGCGGMVGCQTKRGCAFRCAYCGYPSLEGRTVRARDVLVVADELEMMASCYGVDHVFFTDAVFNDPGGLWLSLVEELARRGAPMRWSAYFQPRLLTREELRLARRAGLHAAEVGTDAASDSTLQGMHKAFSFDEVVRVQDLCASEKIPCAHFVIFGGPGETEKSVQEGLKNLERLRDCVVFAFSGIRIHPGAPLYAKAVEEGQISPCDTLLLPRYYFSQTVDAVWMNTAITEAFARRRDRIFPPSKGNEQMEVMHRFGYRGLLWDTLIRFGASGRRGTLKKA